MRLVKVTGLSGGRGLAAAIILQATIDALGNSGDEPLVDAWAYLGGDWYRFHADMLGIAPDAWPVALEHTSVDEFIGITDKIIKGAAHDEKVRPGA
jgi:hypothetical protein